MTEIRLAPRDRRCLVYDAYLAATRVAVVSLDRSSARAGWVIRTRPGWRLRGAKSPLVALGTLSAVEEYLRTRIEPRP